MRTVRTYQDGYVIACDDRTELYHCLHNGQAMMKKNNKPAAYKNLTLAEKFIKEQGAQPIPEPAKSTRWTPPEPAKLPTLEEQLAALPADAPRFVVVEAPYGFYNEQGYACYDREKQEYTNHKDAGVSGWNSVFQERDAAEKVCSFCNTEAPKEVSYHPEFARVLTKLNAEDDYVEPRNQPEPPVPAETEFVTTSPYKAGDEIQASHDHVYIALENSWYVSEKESADAEDMDVSPVRVGYHTKARLK